MSGRGKWYREEKMIKQCKEARKSRCGRSISHGGPRAVVGVQRRPGGRESKVPGYRVTEITRARERQE